MRCTRRKLRVAATAAALAIGVALLLATGATLVRPYLVAGASMEPSLRSDDVILVAGSRLHVPIAVGDVVVVRLWRFTLLGRRPGLAIVKRVVAGAGDVVEAREREGLFANGRLVQGVPTPFSAKFVDGRFYRFRPKGDVWEITADGEVRALAGNERWLVREAAPGPVPSGSFFVLGDNADASVDSLRFGAVRADEIEGKAVVVLYPFERLSLVGRERRRGQS